jgi:hypothetical protein
MDYDGSCFFKKFTELRHPPAPFKGGIFNSEPFSKIDMYAFRVLFLEKDFECQIPPLKGGRGDV